MSGRLMKSVSGIRGVVGDSFTPELVVSMANAFARFSRRGTVILGRDSRPTGAAISDIARSALMLSGCNVVDLGVVPTPTVQVMVEELSADAGLVVSASHNPVEWNAFKLIGKNGSFLKAAEIERFFALMEEPPLYTAWNKNGRLSFNNDASDIHIKKVENVINTSAVRGKRYRVVLDSVNGAGSVITMKLLERLGCEVIPLYCTIDGTFPRPAEPLSVNLRDLAEKVKETGADAGFAQDPDADRLAVVDEKGSPVGEEYTVTMAVERMLSSRKGDVVVNLSTTKAVEDVAIRNGCRCIRTRVGEIHVVEEMRRRKALIGGEGNGGVISPEVHLGRDSLVGIGYILEMMAERNKPVSEIAAGLPRYWMKKGKVNLGSKGAGASVEKIKKTFSDERISDLDGLRIDFIKNREFSGGWVHLRSSNTEPVFRIIAEGYNNKHAERIYRYFAGLFEKR